MTSLETLKQASVSGQPLSVNLSPLLIRLDGDETLYNPCSHPLLLLDVQTFSYHVFRRSTCHVLTFGPRRDGLEQRWNQRIGFTELRM